jgi:nitrite reductase/ring-hydroxylating ferredoxin subunit
MSTCSGSCSCGANLPRRAFLGRGVLGALGAAVATGCGDRVIGGVYPTDPFPTGMVVKLSDFPELAVIGGRARIDGGGRPVVITRTGRDTYEALSLVCPHQGATVDLIGTSTYRCPSHLAEFSATGAWTGGKQTGDLTALGVTLDENAGTLTIDGPAAPAPPPALAVAPSSEVFSAVQGEASPAAQTVAITNAGGGNLTGLATVVAYGAGGPAGWLAATLDTQTAPAVLTLTPTTTSLPVGAYSATVQVTSPTAANAPLSVAVSLLVAAPAPSMIGLAATSVLFAAVAHGSNPSRQSIVITNAGAGTLNELSVGKIGYGSGESGWLAARISPSTAPATLTLTPSTEELGAGTYTATVPVLATAAGNSPQQVEVTLTVAAANAAPSIALSQTSVALSVAQGGSAVSQNVTVQNGGGGSLSGLTLGTIVYAGGGGASGWLSAVLSGSTAPATIAITATPGALGAGTYSATIPVAAAGVVNSPQNIVVTLTVGGATSIVLSTPSVAFNAAAGSSPGGQVVNITSGGSGTLSGISYAVTYGASASGWLSTSSLSATTTPCALTLRAVSNTLAAGTYTATVQVTATGAAPASIAVTLVVGPAGLAVVIANWPALATVGGIAGSVGNVQGTPTAVVRVSATSFAAYSMRCPHQGTTIRIESWKNTGSAFHCPNHDAVFNASGLLLPNSPQKTGNLIARTVTYAPGDTTLYIT